MFNKIQNPITGKWVNIYGMTGKRILENYLSQLGGAGSKVPRFQTWERSASKIRGHAQRLRRRKCVPSTPPKAPPCSTRVRNRAAQRRLSKRKQLKPIKDVQYCGSPIPKYKSPLAPIGCPNATCKQCKRTKSMRKYSPRQRRAIQRNLPGKCINCIKQSRIAELVHGGKHHLARGKEDRPIVLR